MTTAKVTLDLTEYQEMVDTIKQQDAVIKEFKKDSRVVLIDRRREVHTRVSSIYPSILLPKIITTDDEKAKEFLKMEFDKIGDKVIELQKEIDRLKNLIPPTPPSFYEPIKKKSWFWF